MQIFLYNYYYYENSSLRLTRHACIVKCRAVVECGLIETFFFRHDI